MEKILILFAHPRLEKSRVNKMLIKHIPHRDHITFNDLYEKYPDFNIDIEYEQKLLRQHKIIIWHYPFYWYSSPPLLKQWLDLVLAFEWAYGPGGNALEGKVVLNVITAGGSRNSYSPEGHNKFPITYFMRPFEQTANLCKMIYLPPFVVHSTHRLTEEDLDKYATQFDVLMEKLASGKLQYEKLKELELINDICVLNKPD